jgi:hypothetical protein
MSETTTITVRLSKEIKTNPNVRPKARKVVEKADAGGPPVASEDADRYLDARAR